MSGVFKKEKKEKGQPQGEVHPRTKDSAGTRAEVVLLLQTLERGFQRTDNVVNRLAVAHWDSQHAFSGWSEGNCHLVNYTRRGRNRSG